MPVIIDIMDNKVLGRERRKGIEQGLALAYKRGLALGRLEEGLTIVRLLLEKKFGPIPVSTCQRLSKATLPEIEDLSVRLLDAVSLDELLQQHNPRQS